MAINARAEKVRMVTVRMHVGRPPRAFGFCGFALEPQPRSAGPRRDRLHGFRGSAANPHEHSPVLDEASKGTCVA